MKKLLNFLLLAPLIFISCQKEIKKETSSEPQSTTVSAASKTLSENAAVATDWYKLQVRILLERNSALNAGKYWSYMGIGLYEAVRPGIKGAVSFSGKLSPLQEPAMPEPENNQGYNWQVSANAALASMVRSFFAGLTVANNASIDSLESAYNNKLKPDMNSEVFNRSQAYGRSVADAIKSWTLADDFNTTNAGYTLPAPFPGSWQSATTPPSLPINPFVQNATPFVAADLTDKAAPFPLAYSEDPESDFYKMVKQVYDVNTNLTQAQKDTAIFWFDQGNGTGYTPSGHDFLFVTQALEQTNASLGTAAEVYAKAGIALREATIVTFRSKYANFLVRPITYIQNVIAPGSNWQPFIPTPNHPEYPAAHAMVTGPVMQVAERILGPNIVVTDHSYDFRGWTPMTFTSIFNYAEKAGISRNYGGIHYLISINEGLRMAKVIGDRVGDINLHE
jgi:hypothetical protein